MPDGPTLIAVMDTVNEMFFFLERLQRLANSVTASTYSQITIKITQWSLANSAASPYFQNIVYGAG